jgi:hypothetical protein
MVASEIQDREFSTELILRRSGTCKLGLIHQLGSKDSCCGVAVNLQDISVTEPFNHDARDSSITHETTRVFKIKVWQREKRDAEINN